MTLPHTGPDEWAAQAADLVERAMEGESVDDAVAALPTTQRAEVEAVLQGYRAMHAVPDAAPERRDRLGPYILERVLGRGGQGTVYLAHDPRFDRTVALKTLTPDGRAVATRLTRFRREAKLAAKLSDPGICPIYDVGVNDGTAWIAMRRIVGEPLKSAARRVGAAPSPTQIARWVAVVEKVARAAHVAHEAGIVHRDLKPANVVLQADDQPVILDFGLAAMNDAEPDAHLDEGGAVPSTDAEDVAGHLTRTGGVLGTPAYLPPERVKGRPVPADVRTDTWALGVMLYELVCGRRPFDADTRPALRRQILVNARPDPAVINGHVSRELTRVLEQALAPEPADRYQTALAMAEDLAAIRTGAEVPPTVGARVWGLTAAAAALAAVTVVLAAGGGSGSLTPRGEGPAAPVVAKAPTPVLTHDERAALLSPPGAVNDLRAVTHRPAAPMRPSPDRALLSAVRNPDEPSDATPPPATARRAVAVQTPFANETKRHRQPTAAEPLPDALSNAGLPPQVERAVAKATQRALENARRQAGASERGTARVSTMRVRTSTSTYAPSTAVTSTSARTSSSASKRDTGRASTFTSGTSTSSTWSTSSTSRRGGGGAGGGGSGGGSGSPTPAPPRDPTPVPRLPGDGTLPLPLPRPGRVPPSGPKERRPVPGPVYGKGLQERLTGRCAHGRAAKDVTESREFYDRATYNFQFAVRDDLDGRKTNGYCHLLYGNGLGAPANNEFQVSLAGRDRSTITDIGHLSWPVALRKLRSGKASGGGGRRVSVRAGRMYLIHCFNPPDPGSRESEAAEDYATGRRYDFWVVLRVTGLKRGKWVRFEWVSRQGGEIRTSPGLPLPEQAKRGFFDALPADGAMH